MEQLSDWLRNIFIIILSLSFIEIVLPESSMNKYVKFIFSIIVLCVILYPIENLLNKL